MTSELRNQPPREVGQPRPGFFRVRLVRNGPFVAARIVHENGLWWAVIDGLRYQPASDPAGAQRVFFIWHSGVLIDQNEYDRMLRVRRAHAHDPRHPSADPTRPIDLNRAKPLF